MENNIVDYKTQQQRLIELHLLATGKRKKEIGRLRGLLKTEEEALLGDLTSFNQTVREIFKQNTPKDSVLEIFMSEKLPMPHEKHSNCLVAIVEIITELMADSLQYGKTTRGGTGQIGFVGSQAGIKVWGEIEADLKKICNDFFDITPFLDTEHENFPEIGFFMNSKWEMKDGNWVQITEAS